MIRAFTSCALLLALLVQQSVIAAEAEAEWFFDVEVSGGYNDNAGRAERERDIVDDKTLLGGLGVAFNQEFSTEKAITLRAFAEIEDFRNVSDLSRDTYGAQFIYRWQNALGFSAPFYQFNTSVRINEYDVRQRDSIAFTSQLVVSKRVSDRVLVSSGFEYKREESDGIVFDQKQARLFINADYTPAAQWALYGTYSFIHGDIWSTSQTAFCDGTPANDIFDLVSQSEALEPDQAFNNAYCGSWIAYRLNANINTLVLGVNRGFGHRFSFDLSGTRIIVNALANDYDATAINASLLMRF